MRFSPPSKETASHPLSGNQAIEGNRSRFRCGERFFTVCEAWPERRVGLSSRKSRMNGFKHIEPGLEIDMRRCSAALLLPGSGCETGLLFPL
jgi:hypothetical protein